MQYYKVFFPLKCGNIFYKYAFYIPITHILQTVSYIFNDYNKPGRPVGQDFSLLHFANENWAPEK